ncbi:hypothetical protein [Segatella buccae]|uniref:hypothetical protein n=1 Tax=Segatella buccae TaxID=28126 RepID=UPI002151DC41|nr:hypothetical protein [Segatella buccae]
MTIVKLFVRFRPLCLRYSRQTPCPAQMRKFGDVFKILIISRLNFVNTKLDPKTGLKGPKRACKRATVAAQLWPFQLSSVALLQIRRTQMGKWIGFSGVLKPAFGSGWIVLAEVFLLILFAIARRFAETPFTKS